MNGFEKTYHYYTMRERKERILYNRVMDELNLFHELPQLLAHEYNPPLENKLHHLLNEFYQILSFYEIHF
uniref:Uncharacterized protein n=1 Tax=viral metagenome TaxID=1070528 RepID=A0A6C0D0N7_9ZZZZ